MGCWALTTAGRAGIASPINKKSRLVLISMLPFAAA